jgi:uncharacterized phage protein gp47/JayE
MTQPTTQELIDQNLTALETALGQTSPLNDKAFLRVLSVLMGMNQTQLYKYGVERAAQTLALTATEDDLDTIGRNYGVTRKPAGSARFSASTTGSNGVVINSSAVYVGDLNGAQYVPDAPVTIAGGVATLALTAIQQGVAGNLSVGATLTIGSQVAGVAAAAIVTVITALGTDRERDDDYRTRVLDEVRTVGGGSNSADYRRWAQEVAGVQRAYPYAGAIPGDRIVYVQCTTDLDPDGIAPPALLDAVRVSITTDPLTGQDRQALGSVDSALDVEAITCTALVYEVRGLTIPGTLAPDAMAALEVALADYTATCRPFVDGLDSEVDRNDVVTSVSAGAAVNDVLRNFGGFAASIGVGIIVGSYLNSYQLDPGELVKVGLVRYV